LTKFVKIHGHDQANGIEDNLVGRKITVIVVVI